MSEGPKSQGFLLGSEELRVAVNVAGIGLWRFCGGVLELDAHCSLMHGLGESATTMPWAEFVAHVHADDCEALAAAMHVTADFRDLEYRWTSPDERQQTMFCSGSADGDGQGVFGSCLEVTERKQVHQQLMLAQKMEAVGQLTSGISHNFNNILSAILPNLHLASRHIAAKGEPYLRNAQLAAERASDLVAELMVVAGRKEPDMVQALNLDLVIERVVRICKTTFGSWVQIDFDCDEGSHIVFGNEGQLEQVLLNILLNARDAFETMAISCPRIDIELESRRGAEGAIQQVLCVTDNGPGMSPEILGRIFEPFFTSKDTGTGLGLATAYAIVADHDGSISCSSRPDHGSCFEITLPCHEGTPTFKTEAPIPDFVGGNETILVVDDDSLVRQVTIAALKDAGYQVVEAKGGNEAIQAQINKDDFDLVLLDMSMPELTGDQVLSVLRGRDPTIKVLVFTGLSDNRVARLTDVDVLLKPANVNELLQAVRQAIDTQFAQTLPGLA